MSGFLRNLAVTLLLAALVAGVGGWIGARYVLHERQAPSLHELVHDDLDLSAEQERRLAILERDFATRRAAREAQLRQANADLAAAIQVKHEYSPEVRGAVERFHMAMGELQKDTILHVLEMRKILTPEQAAVFDKRVGEALTDQTP